ncbi:PIG-L family deacetylase [Qipengyuania sp. ASV99]|uniref:PIG-L family deacetylase n=1 Tax=Qipengyuania sp. ASV99 TaxID=3399681 RepID=UPI003A4C73A8
MMRQQKYHTSRALAAMLACAALSGAALAQDKAPPQDAPEDGERIEIPRDMTPDGVSRLLNGGAASPAPADPSSPNPAEPQTRARSLPSVLAILAHPDDEITIAPVLARMAREGGEVTVVFGTSGDQGPGVSALEPGAELAALREDEARCAAFAMGLPEPIFWRLGDGALATMARAPDSAAKGMAERITALIALQDPQIVISWGPDGGYGHADHRMVSNVVTEIVQAMGAARPDLLYTAIPAAGADEARPDLPGFEGWATLDPALITDRIRYDLIDLEATRSAVDCYQSQFDETARAVLPDLLDRNLWQGTVYFRLAFPPRP